MSTCIRCPNPLVAGQYVDLKGVGVFCKDCAKELSEVGRRAIEKDRRELGDQVVDARIQSLRTSLNQPETTH